MQELSTPKSSIAFFAFFIGLAALVIKMMAPFLGTIIFALTMTLILKPLYDRLLKAFKGRSGWAVSITLLITVLVPVVIVWAAGNLVMKEISANSAGATEPEAAASVSSTSPETQTRLTGVADQLSSLLENMALPAQASASQAKAEVAKGIAGLAGQVVKTLATLGMSIFNLFLLTMIFLMIVAPMLLNFDGFVSWIEQVSPFPVEITNIFFTKVRLMTLAMFASIFIIAILQGLVMGFFYWLAGVPSLPLFIFLSMLAAMLPFGCSIIAIPVGLYMIFTGNPTGGMIVILGYVLIVSNIDTFLRPALVPKGAALTYALTLLATLGGLYMFGFLGVIYGPVIMILFVTTIQVYQQYYGPRATKQASDAAAP
jgi:predicted PurR-regulated permease PerM